jgi:hypothetical protein
MARRGCADRPPLIARCSATGILCAAFIGVAAAVVISQPISGSEIATPFKLAMGPVSAPHKPGGPSTPDAAVAPCPSPAETCTESHHHSKHRHARDTGGTK